MYNFFNTGISECYQIQIQLLPTQSQYKDALIRKLAI